MGTGTITTQLNGALRAGRSVTRSLSGDVTAVPTPAIIPALFGMGVAAIRSNKKEEDAELHDEMV